MTGRTRKARRSAVLLCLLFSLLLSLSACSPQQKPAADAPEKDLVMVGFSQVGAESDWRLANTASMTNAFSPENGYRLTILEANQEQRNQITAIRRFINENVDYIVLAPTQESGWETVLSEAKDAGIPVIIVDRMIAIDGDKLDTRAEDLFTCWVGSDFRREGDKAVAWMEQTFGDSPLNIVHLQGNLGSSAQKGRTEGLDAGLAAHKNWRLAFRASGEFTLARGQELVEEVLRNGLLDASDPDVVNVIYSENDNMAYGAINALKKAGLKPGEDVVIISFDAANAALHLILEGEISFDVECNPLHGPRVRALIEQLRQGKTPPKYTYVEEETFSRENLTEEIIRSRGY